MRWKDGLPVLHYFDLEKADPNDFWLVLAVNQGYVPPGCLLTGEVVISEVKAGRDPCASCAGPRAKCGGAR